MLAAENGLAALDLLARSGPVDLLIVDMAMPGMNGVELIRRARERRGDLRAMLVTGYADIAAFAPAEGDLILQKPYRLERLAEHAADALRREAPRTGVERGYHKAGAAEGVSRAGRHLRRGHTGEGGCPWRKWVPPSSERVDIFRR
jgi:CheY-like chemotaxis protein